MPCGGSAKAAGLGESRAGKPANSPVGAISRRHRPSKGGAVFYCVSCRHTGARIRNDVFAGIIVARGCNACAPRGEEWPPRQSRPPKFEAPIGVAMTIERMHTGPRMSQVVIHNSTVYLAGQVASGAQGMSVAEQTK